MYWFRLDRNLSGVIPTYNTQRRAQFLSYGKKIDFMKKLEAPFQQVLNFLAKIRLRFFMFFATKPERSKIFTHFYPTVTLLIK